MLSVEAVQGLVLGRVPAPQAVDLPLLNSLGCILAHPVLAPTDLPLWDNSAMDGYAVCLEADWKDPLELIETIPAGVVPHKMLTPGTCSRVMTGAMLPVGTEAVVMQEKATLTPDQRVQILSPPRAGQFIRAKGSFQQQGDNLIPVGRQITPIELGVLASINQATSPVYRPPVVAILSTGDELVSVGTCLTGSQIPDSNQLVLEALVRQCGGIPQPMGIVPDQPEALEAVLKQCAGVDFIVSTGGVSVGAFDYVESVLETLGAEILVRQVNLKPGKPLTFAHWGNTLYWGLPGNPVSALVGFWLTVYPALQKFRGYPADQWLLKTTEAFLTQDLQAGGDRRHYLRGQFLNGNFTPTGSDNSGNFVNLSGVNAFAILEQGETQRLAGSVVSLVLLPI